MDHLAGPNRQTPGKRERTSLPWPREGMHVGEFYTQTAKLFSTTLCKLWGFELGDNVHFLDTCTCIYICSHRRSSHVLCGDCRSS